MKKIIYTILLTILFLCGCKPKSEFIKNNSCSGKVKFSTEWLDSDKQDSEHLLVKHKGGFTIYFVSKYNDSLKMYVDKNDIATDLFVDKKDNSDDFSYAFSFGSKKYPSHILKVESLQKKTCFEIKLDKKYPLIYAWIANDGQWTIRFSNFIHSDNL